MYRNLKIVTKLAIAFCLGSLITLAVGLAGYTGVNRLGQSLDIVVETQLKSILGLGIINEAQTAVQRAERTFMIAGLDRTVLDVQKKRLAEAWANAERGWKIYEPLVRVPEEELLWKEFVPAWEKWKTDHRQVIALIEQGDIQEARALSVGAGLDSFITAEILLNGLIAINDQWAVKEHGKSMTLVSSVKTKTVVMVIAGFIFSALIGFLSARAITRPLTACVRTAQRISAGDLDTEVSINTRDETGQLLEAMQEMIGNLRQRNEELNNARERAESGNKNLVAAQRIAGMGNWLLDLESGNLEWSDEIFRIFEVDREQFGASYAEFLAVVHPDDREAVNSAYQQSLITHERYEIIHRLLMPDGRIKYVEEQCESTFTEAGRVLRSHGTVQDITERRLAEIEVQKNQEQLASQLKITQYQTETVAELLDFALEEALVMTGSRFGYLYRYDVVTAQFTLDAYSTGVMKECTTKEVKTCYELDKTGLWGEVVRQRAPIMVNDFQASNPLKKGYPEGHVQLTRFLSVPIIINQQIVAVVGVANKQSDYDRNDVLRLTLMLDGIWKRAERITVDQELRHARDEAQAASRAKSEFLANMSHELRTPMNGVLGMAQLIGMADLSAEQRGYLDCLESSGSSMLSVINDILDLTRVEAGKLALEITDFTLRDCVNGTINTLSGEIGRKSHRITTEIAANVPEYLHGDPLRLRQILLNLLSNAVKFTPDNGNVTITAEAISRSAEEILLHISVYDSGIGISPENLENIFAPFTQIDGSSTREFGGIGLGLTISRRLAGLMGGRVWAESSVGSGSRFHVELPFTLVAAGDNEEAGMKSAALPYESARESLRIMVAEDNPINAQFMEAALAKLGHRTVIAENGREALDQWRKEHFDAILMDIQMPEMNGVDALHVIRLTEKQTGRHIPVIAVTAFAMDGDRERLLADGFDGYLSKPLKIDDIFKEIVRVVEKH